MDPEELFGGVENSTILPAESIPWHRVDDGCVESTAP